MVAGGARRHLRAAASGSGSGRWHGGVFRGRAVNRRDGPGRSEWMSGEGETDRHDPALSLPLRRAVARHRHRSPRRRLQAGRRHLSHRQRADALEALPSAEMAARGRCLAPRRAAGRRAEIQGNGAGRPGMAACAQLMPASCAGL
ncbi:hypothetical protein SI859A1_01148 [Aurantimonas manganoxydans SI85-9A1]|uniref:Uncharacterized protein n=1 Tax=Aurantimonas manganoxydans (strain ATCC BAA-1229 / DSM 21871 / SI85-9A1) TaxID=287752 RepID=Q1YEC7_AURMS|nr:hypothetical protein SI859A1_01148 [Aurantimonas manganoxydans SI85-9A1]